MMLAILEANPEAFAIRNVKRAQSGRDPEHPGPGRDRAGRSACGRRRGGAPACRMAGASKVGVHSRRAGHGGCGFRNGAGRPDRGRVARDGRRYHRAGRRRGRFRRCAGSLPSRWRRRTRSAAENDEFKLRLADAENRIGELNRLVELKSEEIAGLQSELSARSGVRCRHRAGRSRLPPPGSRSAS